MSKKKSKEKVVEYSKLEHKVAAVWTRVSTGKQADNNIIRKSKCSRVSK